MSEMSEKELQQALEIAERHHVAAENSIQRAVTKSKTLIRKAIQLREIAKERNINLQSLHEKKPGRYEILKNTYRLLE